LEHGANKEADSVLWKLATSENREPNEILDYIQDFVIIEPK
jgi:hypothetical protein